MNNKQTVLNQVAQKILRENIYLTLATADKKPWASPVYYCLDPDFNLYFISLNSSIHAQNISKNKEVAFAVFDSRQKEGTGQGVQGSGKAHQLKGFEVLDGLRWYHTKYVPMNLATLRKVGYYRLFKLIPEKLFVLDPEAAVDKRVEVQL